MAKVAFNGGDLRPIAADLMERIRSNDQDADALMDLSTVLQLMGQREGGLAIQALSLDIQQHFCLKGTSGRKALRLLSIQSPGDLTRNNALEFLVEDSDIEFHLLYVTPDRPLPANLPDHDLAIVAVCQSEQNRSLLNHLEGVVKEWPQPVLCKPERINRLSRDGAYELLHGVPGLVMPLTARLQRDMLTRIIKDADFPVIVRPVDSDKGFGLMKLDDAPAVAEYLSTRPEGEFFVSRYVNYQDTDGQFRKYRIVLIAGRPYVCHMAISGNWMVHYMSAGMFESAAKRDEEARFFANFEQDFAVRHSNTLLAIAKRLDLEYVGIDCGETPEGELLIFEVDSGMTVHSMDPPDLFPYKIPQMRKVFGAFREMLINAA
jgi:hypothetical protein